MHQEQSKTKNYAEQAIDWPHVCLSWIRINVLALLHQDHIPLHSLKGEPGKQRNTLRQLWCLEVHLAVLNEFQSLQGESQIVHAHVHVHIQSFGTWTISLATGGLLLMSSTA